MTRSTILSLFVCALLTGCRTGPSHQQQMYVMWHHRGQGAFYTWRDLDAGEIAKARDQAIRSLAACLTQMHFGSEDADLTEFERGLRERFARQVLDYTDEHKERLRGDASARLVIRKLRPLLHDSSDLQRLADIATHIGGGTNEARRTSQ